MAEARLYDTSAAIELVARRRAEIIPGYISAITAIEYPPAIPYSLGVIYPTKRDYKVAIVWQVKLRKLGSPLPAADLLIPAQAYNNQLELVTLDKHFAIIREKLAPELKLVMNV